ncbi:YwmB family TATA-box binding protein [Virgibacillus sp. NKC19-16]|uniref:YwmB family TATA-box binding protein n=1 Tax=Virgibacillus salidurans TaxID=2831673 RepID=UPI001F1C56B7|nr:YwmB family TATA-box binding protein [Virgibacillus sp. NKC19-16]UJL45976.1 YwmB family TATA-box binding protein [Virgibacillus sp. NKC19-16]
MRKLVFISLLFLFITSEATAGHMQNDEMMELASVVTDSYGSIGDWEVILKEKMDKNDFQDRIIELKNRHLVTVNEDENSIQYSFEHVHESSSISVIYNGILPKNGTHDAELIAVIKGTHWNTSIEENYQSILDTIRAEYFTKFVEVFACLTTDNGDIMNNEVFLNELMDRLKLQHMETQFDTVEKSRHEKIIYGYTPLWEQKITIGDIPMNVQIAAEESGNGDPTYTIGTPILINEY